MVRSASRRPSSIFATKLPPNSTSTSQSHGSIFSAFKLGGERLDELLVLRAVGKKDFHPWPIRWGHIILCIATSTLKQIQKRDLKHRDSFFSESLSSRPWAPRLPIPVWHVLSSFFFW